MVTNWIFGYIGYFINVETDSNPSVLYFYTLMYVCSGYKLINYLKINLMYTMQILYKNLVVIQLKPGQKCALEFAVCPTIIVDQKQ